MIRKVIWLFLAYCFIQVPIQWISFVICDSLSWGLFWFLSPLCILLCLLCMAMSDL